MRIAINTRFLLTNKLEGFGWYSYEICKRLVESHPEHTFIFFFDRPYDSQFVFGDNVIPVVLKPAARHAFLFYYWFEFAVTKALTKYKADLFFSPDGYLSLGTKIPQIAVIHDINFAHFPEDLPKMAGKYLNYFFPKFALKAKKIITVSAYSKQDLVTTYGIESSKISVIWNGASDAFVPLSAQQKSDLKSKLTGGKDYFVFVGSLHPRKNVARLIEAYLLFKTNYPDGFDLVIVGENLWKNKGFNVPQTKLQSSIHFTGRLDLDSLTKVMGAASSLVYVPYFEGFGIPLVEAMKCGVPLIAGNKTSIPEVVGDAGILVDPYSVEEITDALCRFYLDPSLQKELSVKSLERGKLFSWDLAAQSVWNEIESLDQNQ